MAPFQNGSRSGFIDEKFLEEAASRESLEA